MKHASWWALMAVLIAASPTMRPDTASFRIHTDISRAPEDGPYAEEAKAVCEKWYRQLNEILFGPSHPLPFQDVLIVFDEIKAPAVTSITLRKGQAPACEIRIRRDQQHRRDSFGGMVIHELAHVVQNYPPSSKYPDWIEEGIADYIRHKYFETDIVGKLAVNDRGYLHGYTASQPFFFGLQENKVSLERKGYLKAYTVASEFLYWLEQKRDKDIVRRLAAALSQGRYSPKVFREHCGSPLDELWRQFLAGSRH